MDKFAELRDKILPILLPYARRVAVFGSFVRGDEKPDSDIDLLVAWKPGGKEPPSSWGQYTLVGDLERILARPVDLIEERLLNPHVRPHVEKELLVLYEEGKPLPNLDGAESTQAKGRFRKDPMVYLHHILDAIDRVEIHLDDIHSWDEFIDDITVQAAVVRGIEIIGEAARKLPPGFREAHPEVEWAEMIGMRHRVAHDYTNIHYPTVWRVTQEFLIPLRAAVEAILRDE